MDTVDKINFAFNAYDFEATETLYFDELTLLFRACLKGLAKACPAQIVFTKPTNKDAETFSTLFFTSIGKNTSTDKITIAEFQSFCSTHPVVSSWLKLLASIPTVDPKATVLKAASHTAAHDDLELRSIKHWSKIGSGSQPMRISKALRPTLASLTVTEDDLIFFETEQGGDEAG